MSIGRVGMWPVDAPGVLDVHAFVYFDGTALFIQSADAGNPAKGNGQAIGTAWQQIEIPCTIEMGRARLVYRMLDDMEPGDDDKTTVAQQIPLPPAPPANRAAPQFVANAGAFSNRNQGPDSDATRLQPMAREPDPTVVSPMEAGTPMAGVPKARPAAGMPAWAVRADASPNSSPTTIGAPPAPPPPQNMGYQAFGSVQVAVPPPPAAPNPMVQTLNSPMGLPQQQPMMQQPMMGMGMQMQMQPTMPGMPMGAAGSGPMMALPPGSPGAETGRVQAPGELKGFARAKAEWNAMPPIRKIIIGTFPGVLLLVYFMLFDDEPQQQVKKPRPPTSATASISSTPPSTTGSAPTTTTTSTGTTTAPTTTIVATATTTAPTTTVTAPATTTAPLPTTTASQAPLPKGKRTPEREAVDLVGQGQYVKAAEIYEQLAAQHPDQPAYREAARILRARGNGG